MWVQNNAINILIARTDAWNETRAGKPPLFADDMLAKLGKLTINFDPADFGQDAELVLKLEQGAIELKSGTGSKQKSVRIWVDANAPDIRIESHGAQAFPMTVSFDNK